MNLVLMFRRMPFLRLLLPLVLGVVVGSYALDNECFGWMSLLFLGVMLLVALLPFFDGNYRFRWFFGVLLFAQIFSLGAYRMSSERASLKELVSGGGAMLLAELSEDPKEKPNSYAVEAWVGDSSMPAGRYALQLYVAKDSQASALRRGDVVAFPDNLFRKRNLNPGEFDFESLLRRKGISGQCYLSSGKWRWVGHRDRFSLSVLALRVQRSLLAKLERHGLGGEELALVSAMVLGNRDYMEASLRNSYSATGASHILAVSGLHVGVVFFVLDFVLKMLFRKRMRAARIALLLLSLWGYAFVTGLPASVVRASFMLSLVCLGKLLSRSSSVFNTVSVSAFFMLLYNPNYLFDVGFQLSYAAVFSILFFQPKIKSAFQPKRKAVDWAWSLLSVSLAAQLGTLPIVLFYFHQFPNYFWLSGLWVVPLSAVVIYAALLFFAMPIDLLCDWVAHFLSLVACLMNEGVHWIERLPCALVENIRYGGLELFLSYCVVGLLAMFLFRRNLRWGRTLLVSFSVVALLWGVNGCRVSQRKGVAVYNVKGVSVVNRYGFGRNDLSCDGDVQSVVRSVSSFWVDCGFPKERITQDSFFLFRDKVVYIVRDTSWRRRQAQHQLDVEVLVVGRDAVSSLSELTNLFHFNQLVLDSSNSWRTRKRLLRECREQSVACWDVAESGAWVWEE